MTDHVADKRQELLARIASPGNTAVVTMEMQNGVVGPDALLLALHHVVAESGMLAVAGRVCAAARASGIRVVHCTAEDRADGAGFAENCKIFTLSGKRRRQMGFGPNDIGTHGAQVVDELDVQPSDIVVPRLSGMSPFTPSALDQILRNLGVTTIALIGVSVNLGIFGAAMSALDLGYQVIVVRDAVVGVPMEYAQMVLDNSISMIATVVTADQLLEAWR
jgi:biuret amidohydrolase